MRAWMLLCLFSLAAAQSSLDVITFGDGSASSDSAYNPSATNSSLVWCADRATMSPPARAGCISPPVSGRCTTVEWVGYDDTPARSFSGVAPFHCTTWPGDLILNATNIATFESQWTGVSFYNNAHQPWGDAVPEPDDDPRLAGCGPYMVETHTALGMGFLITNGGLWAYASRGPGCVPGWVAAARLGDAPPRDAVTRLGLAYSSPTNSQAWSVDGVQVKQLGSDDIGLPPSAADGWVLFAARNNSDGLTSLPASMLTDWRPSHVCTAWPMAADFRALQDGRPLTGLAASVLDVNPDTAIAVPSSYVDPDYAPLSRLFRPGRRAGRFGICSSLALVSDLIGGGGGCLTSLSCPPESGCCVDFACLLPQDCPPGYCDDGVPCPDGACCVRDPTSRLPTCTTACNGGEGSPCDADDSACAPGLSCIGRRCTADDSGGDGARCDGAHPCAPGGCCLPDTGFSTFISGLCAAPCTNPVSAGVGSRCVTGSCQPNHCCMSTGSDPAGPCRFSQDGCVCDRSRDCTSAPCATSNGCPFDVGLSCRFGRCLFGGDPISGSVGIG